MHWESETRVTDTQLVGWGGGEVDVGTSPIKAIQKTLAWIGG